MVAYSFHPQFVDPIIWGTKLQTVRAHRARHARVSEPIQLYTGMRTKVCRKLVDPDPVCCAVSPITIKLDPAAASPIYAIIVDGTELTRAAMQDFAIRDGFVAPNGVLALKFMGDFWLATHNQGTGHPFNFDGVVIRWRHP